MTRRITPQTNLDNLKKEAKRWLKELHAGESKALARLKRIYPNAPAKLGLRAVQHAISLEFGYSGWAALKASVGMVKFEALAKDMVAAYAGDAAAMQRIRENDDQPATVEDLRAIVWRQVYKVRQARGAAHAFDIAAARALIAQTSGFGSWTALAQAVSKGLTSPAYTINQNERRMEPRRLLRPGEWDTIIGVMKEQHVMSFHANGQMTDDALKRIAELEHVTSLTLGGSRQLTDDGLLHLAGMPQLEHLDLFEYPGGKLTDRGLAVLRHLPNLRTFNMSWQSGISDDGAANLRYCEKLEVVNLMGTATGDAVIRALRGKPNLHRFHTGKLVTDAGLPLLHDFPRFKSWHVEQSGMFTDPDDEPTHLQIDGPFTNQGLAQLAGLDGLYGLDLFWNVTGITSGGFEVLARLRNLCSLACDGEICDDEAMRHIAAIPRLLKLRAQESVATDKGFIALSHSGTLERFWGRHSPNLTGVGFVAMSKMPALRSFGTSCKNVDDKALSTLPLFPALRELTPVDFQDAGFRHVGRCNRMERLSCMYCRETTDAATEHIADLQLKSYYAGLTQITDRSLEILGRMQSLESIEFYETKDVTDAGLLHLVKLPRLREIRLTHLPKVTLTGTSVFPARVNVDYYA